MAETRGVTAWEPHARAETCKLLLDRPVLPGGKAGFASASEARGLAPFDKLFAIESVTAIAAEHDVVLLWKQRDAEWPAILEQARWILHEWLQESAPAAVTIQGETPVEREARIRVVVEDVLLHEVNPTIAAHGGKIVLLDVKDTAVYVEMQGGCQGCGMSMITLKRGLTAAVRARAPDVGGIHDTTDHAAGTNPYYRPPASST